MSRKKRPCSHRSFFPRPHSRFARCAGRLDIRLAPLDKPALSYLRIAEFAAHSERMFMDAVLVTGGCGFIGSNFVRHLISRDSGVRIINLDRLTYAGNPANLADLADEPRYRFVHGDIANRRLVLRLCREVSSVINFAAESHVDHSIRDARPFLRTNVIGTQVLLEAARTCRVERYLQVSTDEVYGSLGPTGHFTEETPLAPRNP